jgi:HSP20 family protein
VGILSEKKEGSAKEQDIVPVKPSRKTESTITPYRTYELRQEFDRALDRLRKDFEDILWPSERIFERRFPMMREFETRMPSVDLEDRGKDFLLTAEIPGFKKEEVEVQVQDNAVEIRGNKSASRDEKVKGYIRKERSSESFYRRIRLPEEVKTANSEANLKNGVLELVLPKKAPKPKKKVNVK